jgi:hypothetical protein
MSQRHADTIRSPGEPIKRRMRLNPRELHQIDAAIVAHSQWITQLKIAIEDGTSKFDPDIVMADNHCEFGKWLYDDFPTAAKKGASFELIRETHAAFHRNAATILRLALTGNRAAAVEQMNLQGEFMRLSGRLILLLKDLRG